MIPPHLPPPVCNIKEHHQWQRIKIIMAAAVFGLIAGFSGASMLIGWVWPQFGGGDSWVNSQSRLTLSKNQLEEKVRLEMADRLFTGYRSVSNLSGVEYFAERDRVGSAMAVSSDGWMAMRTPAVSSDYRNWRFVGADGKSYKIGKILTDDRAQISYLKINISTSTATGGNNFKVVSFPEKISNLDEIYVWQNNSWHYSWVVNKIVRPLTAGHLDSAPITAYVLNGDFAAGSIVVNNQGRVMGLVGNDGFLYSYEYITRILPRVLSDQKITYSTLGVEGWFNSEQAIILNSTVVNGFLVTRTADSRSKLRRGDVIMEINGKIVDPDILWYNINTNTEVTLKIWRAGKEIIIKQTILKIS